MSHSRFVQANRRASGFTLPELIIAALIAAAIAALTGQVMIGQLLEGRRLESAQRVRENFSRFNYLVQVEASESRQILLGGTDECPDGDDGFTLLVPQLDGDYEVSVQFSAVRYANAAAGVTRCGPPVERNGVLRTIDADGDSVENETELVLPGAQLTTGCEAVTPGRGVSYQLEFDSGNFGELIGECVEAHAKSIFVPNPD